MQHLTRAQASEFLTSQGYPVARSTLQKYATVGGGPRYQRFGNRVLYTEANLLDWAKNKLSTPIISTSEESTKDHWSIKNNPRTKKMPGRVTP